MSMTDNIEALEEALETLKTEAPSNEVIDLGSRCEDIGLDLAALDQVEELANHGVLAYAAAQSLTLTEWESEDKDLPEPFEAVTLHNDAERKLLALIRAHGLARILVGLLERV